ncbi:RNA helicase aquarius-like isoform X2 [Montipora capricornis]|uniref:RNA helicase aquarius-like isoform X2 n=1 Tax=Montipora capricornis TaxID=246305 RepID=UPI0035F152D7
MIFTERSLKDVCCKAYLAPRVQTFKQNPQHFHGFFQHIMELSLSDEETISSKEQSIILVFLIHCFNILVCGLLLDQ